MKKNKIVISAVLAFLMNSCAGESDACRAITNMGFTRCKVMDTDYFGISLNGCHQEDNVSFELSAVNPGGQQVNLVACCGWFSCTIRSN